MTKHARVIAFLSTVLISAAAALGASRLGSPSLTVHEWGTFTSVAGPDGQSVNWQPLSGPQDLPCFVSQQNPAAVQVKGRDIFGLLKLLPDGKAAPAIAPPPPTLRVVTAKIRMETPVLYFYAPEAMGVSVKVGFQQGVISEWYPKATVPPLVLARPLATTIGAIEWPSVRIVPNLTAQYPRDQVKSHYYAAREVDATPVLVDGEAEKFLFYRGVADFQPPVVATVQTPSEVRATGPAGTRLILFENRNGRVGYRVVDSAGTQVTLSRRSLEGSVDGLRSELESMLVAEGLYPREAKAMVETWRDSWFEEGARIFYVMPRAAVDARLPLTISPTPSSVARVFVGRLELITPEMKDDVERAIVQNDLDALNRYGRFLDTVVLQIADRPSMSAHPERLSGAVKSVAASHPLTAACQ